MLLEIKVTIEQLTVFAHLTTQKVGELERASGFEVALKLGGSKNKLRDLKSLAAYLRNRLKIATPWRNEHIIEIKDRDLNWLLMFLREEFGVLTRAGASNYGSFLKIQELEEFIKYLEKQKKEAKVILS
jgi:coproporphyrinogen III oxidase-like Fe-S oxidoreductase